MNRGYKIKVANHSDAISVREEDIEEAMKNSEFIVSTVFDKCTIVSCKLPSGFVIVEYSACVDPENYDKNFGVEICMNRIKEQLFDLEAYKLQNRLFEESYYDDEDDDYDDNDNEDYDYENWHDRID